MDEVDRGDEGGASAPFDFVMPALHHGGVAEAVHIMSSLSFCSYDGAVWFLSFLLVSKMKTLTSRVDLEEVFRVLRRTGCAFCPFLHKTAPRLLGDAFFFILRCVSLRVELGTTALGLTVVLQCLSTFTTPLPLTFFAYIPFGFRLFCFFCRMRKQRMEAAQLLQEGYMVLELGKFRVYGFRCLLLIISAHGRRGTRTCGAYLVEVKCQLAL